MKRLFVLGLALLILSMIVASTCSDDDDSGADDDAQDDDTQDDDTGDDDVIDDDVIDDDMDDDVAPPTGADVCQVGDIRLTRLEGGSFQATNHCLAFDSQDRAVVASLQARVLALFRQTGASEWEREFVACFALAPALVLDGDDKVHLVYRDLSLGAYRYATDASGEWESTVVYTDGDVDYGSTGYADIALDANGKVHLALYDSQNQDLVYATNVSGAWQSEVVDSAGDMGQGVAMVIRPGGQLALAYIDAGGARSKLASGQAGNWQISGILAGGTSLPLSLAVDGDGFLHMTDSLGYATNRGGFWDRDFDFFDLFEAEAITLALSADDQVRVLYGGPEFAPDDDTCDDDTAGDGGRKMSYEKLVKIAVKTGDEWECEEITSVRHEWEWSLALAAAIDGEGETGVSLPYMHLYYVKQEADEWNRQQLGSGDYAGDCAVVAADSQGRSHVLYNRLGEGVGESTLQYATDASGEWEISTMGDTGYTGYLYRHIGVVVDENDAVHAVYADDTWGSLHYLTNQSGQWVDENLGLGGAPVSMEMDGQGFIHLAYGSTGDRLYYVTNATGEWISEEVDRTGWKFPALALDADGGVHLSFYNGQADLVYANNLAGTWGKLVVADLAQHADLAVDRNGVVHLVYVDYTAVMYAHGSTAQFSTEVLEETGGDNAQHATVALGADDSLHVGYYYVGVNERDLKYATNASGDWEISIIDWVGNKGEYAFLVVDDQQRVHIAYEGDRAMWLAEFPAGYSARAQAQNQQSTPSQ